MVKKAPIRVLVVDDSAYIRKVVREMLESSPDIEVVGAARNGLDALEKVAELRPDVITLDLIMPEMDGIAFLQSMAEREPLPVVVVSIASEEGEKALAALEAGAVDFVQKPTSLATEKVFEIQEELVAKVRAAATVSTSKLSSLLHYEPAAPPMTIAAPVESPPFDALVIGASTGGPQALRYLLERLPVDFPLPVAIVLHMPLGYTGPFAQRLNALAALEVREARSGDEMQPGRVLMAPAGWHLKLAREGEAVVAKLDVHPLEARHRPSVDALFRSAAEIYGSRVVGMVLTGMGEDGKTGAAWIKAQGGIVLAEAESSCVVYGMPRAVIEAGLADEVAPLSKMLPALCRLAKMRLAHSAFCA
ncbi:MAG: chemotaxis response regulator protein-glutamate methylesterase [Chloroflexi bacterium]|nr:chemotaxis response regulator protein-glutamate methylesterase [Chloroflexota bacterium]